jgi:hypothetical protein
LKTGLEGMFDLTEASPQRGVARLLDVFERACFRMLFNFASVFFGVRPAMVRRLLSIAQCCH